MSKKTVKRERTKWTLTNDEITDMRLSKLEIAEFERIERNTRAMKSLNRLCDFAWGMTVGAFIIMLLVI